MGGYRSGRRGWRRTRAIKEDCLIVSSTRLYRKDILRKEREHPSLYTVTYSYRNRQKEHQIGVEADAQRIKLQYTVTDRSGDSEEFDYPVRVEWTPCNFGGHRPWFRCPAQGCNRRVEKLYKPPHRNVFACRECHDISYHRCNISGKPTQVAMHKKQKIAEKLGAKNAPTGLDAAPPPRPKHMHSETYEELVEEWRRWDDVHHIAFTKQAQEMIGFLEEDIGGD